VNYPSVYLYGSYWRSFNIYWNPCGNQSKGTAAQIQMMDQALR
jgi:hypothetical protein